MTELSAALIANEAQLIADEVENALQDIDLIQYKVEQVSNQRRLFGKTAEEWITYFTVKVSPHAGPVEISSYCAELTEKLGKAYDFKLKTQNYYATYMISYEEQMSQEISRHALNKSRKVMPSSETLELVAHSQMGNRKLMYDQYKIYVDFWQNIIYKLKDTLELVKTMAMSNGTLAKAERGAY